MAIRVTAERLNSLKEKPDFKICDFPKTKEEWLNIDGIKFEKIICSFMGWEWSGKGRNDGGVDGWAKTRRGGRITRIPVQIKNHRNNIGRPDMQKFVGSMGEYKLGIFVAWSFAPSVRDYLIDVKRNENKEVVLLHIEEILKDILLTTDKKMELEGIYRQRKTA
ncbi:MAG: restriction endonuclease [Halobacteriovoraceae bacterium]|nr:restriction endonuclease [Halobacteriovoraceae bacterium]